MRISVFLILMIFLAAPVVAMESVVIQTNKGDIHLELDDKRAPESVKNFLRYADTGFYDGTIFHRVIKDFMIQGGGFDTDLDKKATLSPIKNEATNRLPNNRGTISMARTGVVDSATSQFFINHRDNHFLNHRDTSSRGYGYAVFGRVTKGMEVVDAIAATPTVNRGGAFRDIPRDLVIIQAIKRAKKQ